MGLSSWHLCHCQSIIQIQCNRKRNLQAKINRFPYMEGKKFFFLHCSASKIKHILQSLGIDEKYAKKNNFTVD